MLVRDIMTQPVITVGEDTSLEQVVRLMLKHRIGGVPVVDAEGRLRGIVTESDFLGREQHFPFSTFRWAQILGQWLPKQGIEEIYRQARAIPVKQIMSTGVITANEDDRVEEVVRQIIEGGVHLIPVVRDNVPIGVVACHDLLRVVLESLRSHGRGAHSRSA